MSSFLSFLSNVVIENVTDTKVPRATGKKQRNPEPDFLGFRVWADGSCYPSVALVAMFNLEYPKATVSILKDKDGADKLSFTVVGDQGMGFDVIDTRQWSQIKGAAQGFIAVAVSPKDSPKLDMFSMTRYSPEGNPLTSIMDQGSSTYGKATLLPLIAELYKVSPNEEGFIDMQVITVAEGGQNLRSANGLELLPKVISRGADAGKPDYTRRENVDIFMIYPSTVPALTDTAIEAPTAEELAADEEANKVFEGLKKRGAKMVK